jgi:hypothetical protein
MKAVIEAKPAWRRGGLAVVCEKCTKERFVEDFPEFAGDERLDNVKGYLKNRLRSEGRSDGIRVIASSCLDVCARGGLTVLLDPLGDPNRSARCLVFDALEGREALYAAIVADLTPPAAEKTTTPG